MRVFVFGSRKVVYLTSDFKEILLEHCRNNNEILVGDCYGLDNLVQQFLYENNYFNVTVYHIKDSPRYYNIMFKRKQIKGFYQTDKDIAMCNDCDFYLCLVRDYSKGSIRNLNQLISCNKKGISFNAYGGYLSI